MLCDLHQRTSYGSRSAIAPVLFLVVAAWVGGCVPERLVAVSDGSGTGGAMGGTANAQGQGGGDSQGGAATGGAATGGAATGGAATGGAATGGAATGGAATGGAATGGAATGGASACSNLHSPCKDPQDCCSEICSSSPNGKTCGMPPACRKPGDSCTTGTDCCSGACGADGHCPANYGCGLIGEPCSMPLECCSGVCADPGIGGGLSCQAIDGCRPVGEVCSNGSDCCSQLCTFDAAAGFSHCSRAPNCAPAGEVCVIGFTDKACCSSRDGSGLLPPQYCVATVAGVNRCVDVGSQPDYFLTDGSFCEFGGQCLGHFCLPSESGKLKCASACIPVGSTGCLGSRDCCSGICTNGKCQAGVACGQLGQRCTGASGCCGGFCMPDSIGTGSHCVL